MSVEQKNSNEKPRQNPYSGIIFGIILLLLLNGLVAYKVLVQAANGKQGGYGGIFVAGHFVG